MSMLVGQAGHTDITVSAKNIERTADMDLYNETGEVLLFIENYTNPDVMGTQMIPKKESQKVEGYVTRNKLNTKNYKLALLDSSNSVTKITVDGKKTYKLKKVKTVTNIYSNMGVVITHLSITRKVPQRD